MWHAVKCNKENKIDYIKVICNGIENGGEIKQWNMKTKLIDVSEQHSIDKALFNESIDC